MIKEDKIYNLIEKQYQQIISNQELQILDNWYNESENNKVIYIRYYSLIKRLNIEKNKRLFQSDTETSFNDFLNKISVPKKRFSLNKLYRNELLKYIAIAILFFGLGGMSFYLVKKENAESLVQTIEIPYGSKSRVTLPDGTVVWLNSGSNLTYNKNFGITNRDIKLNGEGFFDVTKNKDLPLHIYSGDVKIKVLGTKFNFKSYSDDESSCVTLVEGSLNVERLSCTKQALLKPNQQVFVNKEDKDLSVKNVNASIYARWTEPANEEIKEKRSLITENNTAIVITPTTTLRNTLFFNEESFNQIVRDLERVFNVNIKLEDEKLGRMKFYGDFRNDETLTDILDIMAMNNNLRYRIENNVIFISKK